MSIKYINGINETLTWYLTRTIYLYNRDDINGQLEMLCWRKPIKAIAAGMGLPTWWRKYHQILQSPVPICIMLKGHTTIIYRWPRARPQQLQCVGNGATTVPHQAIDISLYFFHKLGWQCITYMCRMDFFNKFWTSVINRDPSVNNP